MSLSYAQAVHLCHEIRPLLEEAVCLGVSSPAPYTYVIAFRRAKIDYYLFFCLVHGYVRFHLLKHLPEAERRDLFSKLLNGRLAGTRLTDFSLLNEDRILSLAFSGNGAVCRLIVELFPRRPNCLLIDAKDGIVHSLHPVDAVRYAPPEKPASSPSALKQDGNLMKSGEVEAYYAALEAVRDGERRRQSIVKLLEQRVKKAEKRLQERVEILEACKRHGEMHHEGVLLQANLYRIKKGMKEIAVSDWEEDGRERAIGLDPKNDPQGNVEAIFRKAKKLHAGLPHAREQLKSAENDLAAAKGLLVEMREIASPGALERFAEKAGIGAPGAAARQRPKKPEPAKPYHQFMSEGGMEIWVGKSAKDNDLLTFRHAKGLDWWLHARDCPGSHVVLRCSKGQEPDAASLADAAELALRYSKAKEQRKGDVCLTQVKGIVKVKGCPGKVMLSKHKVLHVECDEKRWNRLRHAKNLSKDNQTSSSLKR